MYKLAKLSGVPYSTINDLANNKLLVENLRAGQLRAISKALNLTMEEVYEVCRFEKIVNTKNALKGRIIVKNKEYYVRFMDLDDKIVEERLMPVKREATIAIDSVAEWAIDEYIDNQEMEKAYERLYVEKKG